MLISFTGHRPNQLGGFITPNPVYTYVTKKIEEVLEEMTPECVIVGMAQGVDQWAANICNKLRIPYIAAIPFYGQEKVWPKKAQDQYHDLLRKAKKTEIICDGTYAAWKLQKRNEWMVDHSDLLVAVYKPGSTGGTKNCMDYAKKIRRKIYIIEVTNVKEETET